MESLKVAISGLTRDVFKGQNVDMLLNHFEQVNETFKTSRVTNKQGR